MSKKSCSTTSSRLRSFKDAKSSDFEYSTSSRKAPISVKLKAESSSRHLDTVKDDMQQRKSRFDKNSEQVLLDLEASKTKPRVSSANFNDEIRGDGKDVIHCYSGDKVKEKSCNSNLLRRNLESSSREHDVDYYEEDKDDSLVGLDLDGADWKMSSQEPFLCLSQDGDSQCEVKWDCRSVESIKQFKKLRGQYNTESVKQIISNFSDAHVKNPDQPVQLMGLFLPSQDPFSEAARKGKTQNRATKKKSQIQRVQSRETVQEMINLLHKLSEKRKSENKESENSSLERITPDPKDAPTSKRPDCKTGDSLTAAGCNENDDYWSDEDLFQDNSFLIEATQNPEKFLNSSYDMVEINRRKNCSTNTKASLPSSKCDSVFTMSRTDSTASSNHLPMSNANSSVLELSNTSVIPSTFVNIAIPTKGATVSKSIGNTSTVSKCVTAKSFTSNIAPCSTSTKRAACTTYKEAESSVSSVKVSPAYRPMKPLATSSHTTPKPGSDSNYKERLSGYGTRCVDSVNTFIKNHATAAGVDTEKTKTSFRKFNSFQDDNFCDARSSSHRGCDKVSSNSGQNSSLVKTRSFDSSSKTFTNNAFSVSTVNSENMKLNSSISSKCSVVQPVQAKSSIATSISQTNHYFPSRQSSLSHNIKKDSSKSTCVGLNEKTDAETAFDLSLPDDVLLQLVGPDDVLDSQASIITSSIDKIGQQHQSVKTWGNVPVAHTVKANSVYQRSSSDVEQKTRTCSNVYKAPHNKHSSTSGLMETFLSPVKPLHQDSKNLANIRYNSPMHTFFKKTLGVQVSNPRSIRPLKHAPSSVLRSSTPVKYARTKEEKSTGSSDSVLATQECLDVLSQSIFDDSFMNDEEVFTSQILPMLEKAESQVVDAPEKKMSAASSSPVKCSPEEIAQKRKAALLRRSQRQKLA